MPESTTFRGYRSPVRKLATFFESSRDGWRDKCQRAKQELKSTKLRNRRLAEQRDAWRRRAMEAESRLHASESAEGPATTSMTSDRNLWAEDIEES